ncbi:hypothetical protein EHQ92_04690 [Leptospira biflexa]|uniref:hypothetical protein n=1 Tax=Leptospira biflexa TaxID=172 RepID=UPI0010837D2C|nr:hypothetical protein [Leptospira biflexa]TGM37696.1 hypothetical protein EHQ80_08875 [Leptospira biflexa]TGM41032.1 hypothetical protein EHQ89_03440 [Leptospira biflexa]TGM47234.1 hypothetical protein EHQ92_04690 [Leptospira biflexa]TGM50300.1 hypothetical protein EHQ88_08395 [Leptospira biflexa]TGM55572.1 hypothetical protein EHQ91_11730 [Leptospira biflexa]
MKLPKFILSSILLLSISAFANPNPRPIIQKDKNDCWVISASAVIERGKSSPATDVLLIPIFKGSGNPVEYTDLRKITDPQYKGESIMQFCAWKEKGQKREDVLLEILKFYKTSLLADKDIYQADNVDSDGTTAELTYQIKIGNARGSIRFLIPDSERLDWDSNQLQKLKIKNTNSPIYFSIGMGFPN